MKKPMHLVIAAVLLVVGLSSVAAESRARAPQQQTNTAPKVITMPVGFAGWPILSSNAVTSLQSRLSRAHIESLTDIEGVLPRGSSLMGVRYALCSPVDQNGRAHPYTESVFVCRLNEHKDLVVVVDNRSGAEVVQRWFIRDLPDSKEELKK
jgi:hypothetical protein